MTKLRFCIMAVVLICAAFLITDQVRITAEAAAKAEAVSVGDVVPVENPDVLKILNEFEALKMSIAAERAVTRERTLRHAAPAVFTPRYYTVEPSLYVRHPDRLPDPPDVTRFLGYNRTRARELV